MRHFTITPLGHPNGMKAELVMLSDRERDILRHVRTGKSAKEISQALSLTVATVHTYVGEFCTELGLSTWRMLQAWGEQHPEALIPLTKVEKDLHPDGCKCSSIRCTSLRLGQPAAMQTNNPPRSELLESA